MPKARIVLRVRPRARRTGVTVSESPTSVVEMVRGHSALDKVVVVDGLTQEEAMSRLRA